MDYLKQTAFALSLALILGACGGSGSNEGSENQNIDSPSGDSVTTDTSGGTNCAESKTTNNVSAQGNNTYIFVFDEPICPLSGLNNIQDRLVKKTVSILTDGGSNIFSDGMQITFNPGASRFLISFEITNLSNSDVCGVNIDSAMLLGEDGAELAQITLEELHFSRGLLREDSDVSAVELGCVERGATALYFGEAKYSIFDDEYIEKAVSIDFRTVRTGLEDLGDFIPSEETIIPSQPTMIPLEFSWNSNSFSPGNALLVNDSGFTIYFSVAFEAFVGFFDNNGFLVGYTKAELNAFGNDIRRFDIGDTLSFRIDRSIVDEAATARFVVGPYSLVPFE